MGAALAAWYEYYEHKDRPRKANSSDAMWRSYLGTKYADESIKAYLDSIDAKYAYLEDDSLMPRFAGMLEDGKVVGWFQGRMEFGPRALGRRSIIGDPRNRKIQETLKNPVVRRAL